MFHYFVAYNPRYSESDSKELGMYAECDGWMSTLGFAEVIAKDRIEQGFKNVTIFKYQGDPYDEIITRYVKWELVNKNKVK